METKILEIFTKEEEINKIIEPIKHLSFDDFKKHPHLEFSFMEKLTDHNLIESTFNKFSLIRSIELRENNKGQKSYSLNYELEDGTFVMISLSCDMSIIINAFHAKTNYKRFEKSLSKNYSNKFI